nr:hypothetical protein 1634Bnrm2_p074 [Cryptomonas sp.]
MINIKHPFLIQLLIKKNKKNILSLDSNNKEFRNNLKNTSLSLKVTIQPKSIHFFFKTKKNLVYSRRFKFFQTFRLFASKIYKNT